MLSGRSRYCLISSPCERIRIRHKRSKYFRLCVTGATLNGNYAKKMYIYSASGMFKSNPSLGDTGTYHGYFAASSLEWIVLQQYNIRCCSSVQWYGVSIPLQMHKPCEQRNTSNVCSLLLEVASCIGNQINRYLPCVCVHAHSPLHVLEADCEGWV